MYKTLKEASTYLNKSERTISRYIKKGLLHPDEVKSLKGSKEYRFLEEELEQLKTDIRDDSQKYDMSGDMSGDMLSFMREQIDRKDRQIRHLSLLLGQAQGRILAITEAKPTSKPLTKRNRVLYWVIMTLLILGLIAFWVYQIIKIVGG
jgi:hypothetical protein